MKISELKQIIKEELQKALAEEKELTAREKKLAAMRPPEDKITRGDVIAAAQKKKAGQLDEEEAQHLSKAEKKEKEKIVKGMKDKKSDFEKRYPGRGEEVMYATATKKAKEIK